MRHLCGFFCVSKGMPSTSSTFSKSLARRRGSRDCKGRRCGAKLLPPNRNPRAYDIPDASGNKKIHPQTSKRTPGEISQWYVASEGGAKQLLQKFSPSFSQGHRTPSISDHPPTPETRKKNLTNKSHDLSNVSMKVHTQKRFFLFWNCAVFSWKHFTLDNDFKRLGP